MYIITGMLARIVNMFFLGKHPDVLGSSHLAFFYCCFPCFSLRLCVQTARVAQIRKREVSTTLGIIPLTTPAGQKCFLLGFPTPFPCKLLQSFYLESCRCFYLRPGIGSGTVKNHSILIYSIYND